MRHACEVLRGLKPVMLMVLVQFICNGMNIVYKLAANDGMSMTVLVAYRAIFSAAFTVPLALFFGRKSWTKITRVVLFYAFLCGLFGPTLAQNLYVESLILTSATFVTAICNLIPAVTLILAVCFGLEKLRLSTAIAKAKVSGTLIGIGEVMVFTLYKGVEIKLWSTNIHLLKHSNDDQLRKTHSTGNQILGGSLALGSSTSVALWLIVQTKISKIYPYHYTSTALMSIRGSIQNVILSLCMERNRSQWKLGWNVTLLAVAYTGFVTSGIAMILISWSTRIRGPVFVASFNPLCLVLVAISGSLMLDENLHLGRDSIIGGGLIICGLYIVLWGQSKETKEKAKLVPTESSPRIELVEVASNGDRILNISSTREGSIAKGATSPQSLN